METISEGLEKGVTAGSKERISEIFKISLARSQEVKPRGCPKVNVDTSPEKPESVNLHQVGKGLKSEFGDEAIKAMAPREAHLILSQLLSKGKTVFFALEGAFPMGKGKKALQLVALEI